MAEAAFCTSSTLLQTLTPPAFPRPPACTCALTTHTGPSSLFAAATASSTVLASMPSETGMPKERNRSFAWYSCMFIACPSGALLSGPECPLFVRFVYPGLSMTCKTAVPGSPGFWRCPGLSLSPGRSSCMWPYSFTWLFLACGHAKNAGYGGASGDEPARLPFPEISRARVWEAGFLPAGQSPLGNPCMP